jgi:hypothetical protein
VHGHLQDQDREADHDGGHQDDTDGVATTAEGEPEGNQDRDRRHDTWVRDVRHDAPQHLRCTGQARGALSRQPGVDRAVEAVEATGDDQDAQDGEGRAYGEGGPAAGRCEVDLALDASQNADRCCPPSTAM